MGANQALNLYGDQKLDLASGRGADIAVQRADDLDLKACAHVARLAGENPGGKLVCLDIGCGAGGQAARMAACGAFCAGLDMADMGSRFAEQERVAREHLVPFDFKWPGMKFVRGDMAPMPKFFVSEFKRSAVAVVCQRALHYLPRKKALGALKGMAGLLAASGKLFVSASGMGSELSEGYAAGSRPAQRRFGPLGQGMAEKHGILAPVCLYSLDEFRALLEEAGFLVEEIFCSPFGNVKAVASARRPS